jgi:excisionase family DNA binding protein
MAQIVRIWENSGKSSYLKSIPMDKILTASEVAALLKVHPRTVYNLALQGSIPARKLGGNWRFSKEAILKMVPVGAPASPGEKRGHSAKED